MRTLLLAALFAASLSAATIPQLIESARTKHPSLEAIKLRIAAAEYAVERAKNFDDPLFGVGINDIRLDRPADRSLERMQTHSVTFSQKIPWFGKRDAKEALKVSVKSLFFASLKEAEAELFSKIKQSAYRLWESERLIEVVRRTITLTEQNIELFEAYTASGESGNTHMGIMSAELVKSRLKTALKRLEAQKREVLALLGYLSFTNVESVEIEPERKGLPPLERLVLKIEDSPEVEIAVSKEQMQRRRLELYRLKSKIDPVVRLGYFQRSSFEDYVSIGVGFTLPVYGTQKSEEEEQRVLLMERRLMAADSRKRVAARLLGLYAEAESSRKIVEIIEKESLPQIEHMFDLIRSEIAAGGDLYRFIDLVEQKLRLDSEAITARAKYFITLAKIEAVLGEEI